LLQETKEAASNNQQRQQEVLEIAGKTISDMKALRKRSV